MPPENVKKEALRLVQSLPDDTTWDEIMRRIYIRQSIRKGLEDSEAGRTTAVEDLRDEFGLDDT